MARVTYRFKNCWHTALWWQSFAALVVVCLFSAAASGQRPPDAEKPVPSPATILEQLGGERLPPAAQLESPPRGPYVPGGRRGRPRIPGNVDEKTIYDDEASIRWEEKPTGPTADLSLFGGPVATGRSFVFVIDRSASMGSEGLGAIEAAAEELQSALGRLTDEQKFQVVAYSQTAAYFTGRELIPATSGNQKKLVRFVAGLTATGETQHMYGLVAALKLKPEVIYLFTDGDPALNLDDLRVIREQAGTRTSVHCLQFGRGKLPPKTQPAFQRLARENRGSYLYVNLNQR